MLFVKDLIRLQETRWLLIYHLIEMNKQINFQSMELILPVRYLWNNNDTKHYILLITDAVTRNIILEFLSNFATENFFLAFRCFITWRGLPTLVISKNACIFKRAELELKQLWSADNHQDVKITVLQTLWNGSKFLNEPPGRAYLTSVWFVL